jgi:hypothetical protein
MTVPSKAPRRQPERAAQTAIKRLLVSLGGEVYVLGTTRRRTDSHFGTMQTPGLPDLIAFMGKPRWCEVWPEGQRQLLIVECKADRGRMSPEQHIFRELAMAARVQHVVGGVDDVIAWLILQRYLKPDQVAHYRTHAASTALAADAIEKRR